MVHVLIFWQRYREQYEGYVKYVINIANQWGLAMYLYSNGDMGQIRVEQGNRRH
jgi:hypothetical protein